MPRLPTPRTGSPNFQGMKAVRSRSPARTPPAMKPRSHSAIRSYPGPNSPINTNVQTTVTESYKPSDFPKDSSSTVMITKPTTESVSGPEKYNDNERCKTEGDGNGSNIQESDPRSISPIIEKSFRSPLPTFKLGRTGHITSGSVSSAPGSITPLGSRRIIDSVVNTGETKPEITRTNSNASNLSNLSQSAQEMFMSISSDLTGLATYAASSYALDDFFGIDQGNIFIYLICILHLYL
jgi:hypothetical protein